MKDNPLKRFELLLDIGYQEHVIGVMREWRFSKDKKLNAKRAELVSEEICAPLTAWIDSEYRNGGLSGNAADMEAIQEFSQKADDIVHMLRHNTRPLYPEHISIFNNAWSFFQRSIVHRLYIQFSALQDAVKEVVAEEIERRKKQAVEDAKLMRDECLRKWQKAGKDAATKYHKSDHDRWIQEAKKIIKSNSRVKSIRQLTGMIAKNLGYKPEAAETMRKYKPIIKMLNKNR